MYAWEIRMYSRIYLFSNNFQYIYISINSRVATMPTLCISKKKLMYEIKYWLKPPVVKYQQCLTPVFGSNTSHIGAMTSLPWQTSLHNRQCHALYMFGKVLTWFCDQMSVCWVYTLLAFVGFIGIWCVQKHYCYIPWNQKKWFFLNTPSFCDQGLVRSFLT